MTMLLNALLQGVVLSGVVWIMLMMTGRLNAATRYSVWCITLLAVVALPLRSLVESPPKVENHSWGQGSSDLAMGPTLSDQSATVLPGQFSEASRGSLPRPMTISASDSPNWHPIYLSAKAVRPALVLLWIGASTGLSIRLAAGYFSLRRLKRRAQGSPRRLAARFQSLVARAGMRRRAELLLSADIATPMALGLLRPAILVPTSLLGRIGDNELDQIVLHELAHLRRYDDWMNLMQKLVEALLPIQPMVFWIGRQISLEREIACDDWVIAAAGTPKSYAQLLTRIAEITCWACSGLLASGTAGRPSQLYRRVHRLLAPGGNRAPRALAVPLTGAAGLIAILCWMTACAPRVVALAEPASAATTQPAPGLAAGPGQAPIVSTEPGEQMQSIPVTPGETLAADIDVGNVHVGTWDKQVVQIVARSQGPDADEFLKHHSVSVTREGQEVRVRARDQTFWSHSPQVQIDYEITIPAALDGAITLGAGNLDVKQTTGNLSVTTGAGTLRLNSISGPIVARSGSGNIEVTQATGKITATTGSGTLRLSKIDGPIVAQTGSGNIESAECQKAMDATTGRGNIQIKAFGGPRILARTGMGNVIAEVTHQIKGDSSFKSGMGNVTVTLEETIAVNLSAASAGGSVNSQFPLGPLNGGGPALEITSGMGNIDVRKSQ